MATRVLARSLLTTSRTFSSAISRSYASLSSSATPSPLSNLSLLRLRPLVSVATNLRNVSPVATTVRGFATRKTTSSLNDSNPNWSNRPPKETILLDGCDFEHWLVVMEKPEGDPTRDEIIDSYIKTLAKVVGSEEEARMKLYSVSTRCYYAFGALVSEEVSYKIKELEGVRWVLPDSYLDVRNKDYGGEPVINGVPVPYDPKYHEEWIRNNARANDRNRRNDRPRNFDRSRNFERRRENLQSSGDQRVPPPNNVGGPGGPPPGNMGGPGGPPPGNNYGGPRNNVSPPPSNNWGGQAQNSGGPSHYGGGQSNNWQGQPQPSYGGAQNMGGIPPNNMGGMPNNAPNYQQQRNGPNSGGMPPNDFGGMPNNAPNYQQQMNGPNSGDMRYQTGPGRNGNYQNSYNPNVGGGNPYQTQDIPGRDVPY